MMPKNCDWQSSAGVPYRFSSQKTAPSQSKGFDRLGAIFNLAIEAISIEAINYQKNKLG